jgi:hypothetical protein
MKGQDESKNRLEFDVASQRHATHVPDDCIPSCEPDFKTILKADF